jgi:exopolysaccharide biosynthesis polyprenyl glycosylphosphotransferase
MHFFRRQLLLKGLELFDLSVLGGGFLLGALAYSEHVQFDLSEALAMRLKVSNLVVIGVMLAAFHAVLRANGLYQSRRLSTRGAEARDILKAVTICSALVGAAAVILKIEVFGSRWFLAVFWAASSALLVSSRVLLRMMLVSARRKGRNLRNVLIVGTNPRAAHAALTIENRPELGYRLLGFADDPWAGLPALVARRGSVMTDLENLGQFLRDSVVDEVFVCLPLKSHYEPVRNIIERCESQGIIVRLLGRIFDLRMSRATAETFEDEMIVSVYTNHMDGWPIFAKRIVDIVGSLALLALCSPILLLTMLAIKLTSPGPIFFVQERVGINKRRFSVLKFRTMVVGAEARQGELEALNEAGGPAFKIRNDPRVTSLGRILRSTSIDEMPQLLNVLMGDMSLVGPRPLPVRDYNGFDQDWHRRRFSVRPGITCLWQVNGRSRLTFERWMELDMEYIDRWSLWLDLKILMRTVPAVLKGSGAV